MPECKATSLELLWVTFSRWWLVMSDCEFPSEDMMVVIVIVVPGMSGQSRRQRPSCWGPCWGRPGPASRTPGSCPPSPAAPGHCFHSGYQATHDPLHLPPSSAACISWCCRSPSPGSCQLDPLPVRSVWFFCWKWGRSFYFRCFSIKVTSSENHYFWSLFHLMDTGNNL